uniref:Neurotransmitter-gated ion-channel ligand-binding domain-containing protein n=1 Tax=Plectus sambesii TaxID=2011161 RepID=A0A914WW63_9BILA
MVRSVKNQSSITHVTVSMVINSIVSINEQEEKIELLTWTTLSWTDEFLQWNPIDFGGCEMINTLASSVWMPDYFVVNLLESEDIVSENLLYAVILNNGTIFSSVPLHATLRCTMDITQFPFDTQNCTITAGTWMYTSDRVMLHMFKDVPENAAGVLQGSSEFETISFMAEEHTHVDMNETFSELRFILILKRRPEYYVYVLFIPSFLLTMLCIIGIFTPTSSEGNRNEKMTLGLTTLLSMAVILNITADAMPKSAKGLPLLGKRSVSILYLVTY